MNDHGKMPTGKIGRGALVGSTVVKVGAKKAAHHAKRPFLSDSGRLQADIRNQQEIADLIFNALATLRGTALKAAQLIAMEIELLPEPYRKTLEKSSSQVPPMNRALVSRILRREFGAPNQLFDTFDLTAFAAASLGQVHAATTKEGKHVAVKIQYPGLAEGVTADIALLKSVLLPTQYRRVFADCFPAIEKKVLEELDYRLEASNTTSFKESFFAEKFALPELFPALSTKRVLTTSRLEGYHLKEWLQHTPSQERRNRFGQLLVDFFYQGLFTHHTIHADPNPGNYLFRDDGRLGVIDFGCVVSCDPDFVDAIRGLIRWTDKIDTREELAYHGAAGVHYRSTTPKPAFEAFFSEWVAWLKEPFHPDGYDFGAKVDYFERGDRYFSAFRANIDRYDRKFIYFGRTLHGVMRLLQQLGATVHMAPPLRG